MPVTTEVFGVDDRERMTAALAVRFPVFVDEQQVPAEEEIDEHDRADPRARHVIARDAQYRPVGAGRYYELGGGRIQIGRMAVRRDVRGQQIGRALLDALLDDARSRGFTCALLHAQDHAVEFYVKAGFVPVGETLIECDIVHQPMERLL